MATERPDGLPPAVRAGLLAPYDSWSHRVAIWRFVRDIPLTRRHPTWQVLADLEARLPELAPRPVQLIWGMKDWCFTPECLDKFVQVWPAAEAHPLADVGHWVVEDAPADSERVLGNFLARTDTTISDAAR